MSVPKIDRQHGVPYGTSVHREYIIRTTYPDGTLVDSAPEPVTEHPRSGLTRVAEVGWLAQPGPNGTSHVRLERTVTTMATAWTPVGGEAERDPDEYDDLDDGDR